MLKFIFQKLRNKKWMVVSLLIGNVFLIAIAAANPLYSEAVLQRTLQQDLNTYMTKNNRYSGTVLVRSSYSKNRKMEFEDIERTGTTLDRMIETLDVPPLVKVNLYSIDNVRAVPEIQLDGEKNELLVQLSCYSDFEEHVKLLHGEMYSEEIQDHVIDVLVNERTFLENNLMLGETLELSSVIDDKGIPYRIRIRGVFENKEAQDPYWVSSPAYWNNIYLMDEKIFKDLFVGARKDRGFTAAWYTVLDYTRMRADQVESMLSTVQEYTDSFKALQASNINIYFQNTLKEFVPKEQKLSATIAVLQTPIFILLAAFIFMVSRQMLEVEQNEISVFKSRGASKKQILQLYLLQSALVAGMGIVIGIPLSILLCKVLGSSNAFLEFVQRTALPVRLNGKVWLFALLAAVLSVAAMVLPVFRFADVNIVAHKRKKNRSGGKPWWQKIFLDIILLAVSMYGLYQFNAQKEYLAQQVMDGASLDPMLYFCSSLFMLGAGLLILRLLPWLVKLIFWIGKKWWPPAIYASFLRVMRSSDHQGFLIVFLVLTVAMGIFNTQTARTINANGEEKIYYSIGADLVVREKWENNSEQISEDPSGTLDLTYIEPDFDKYRSMDGVVSATKVLVDNEASLSVESGRLKNVKVMGIHTKEFGETAWFKEELLPHHWYEYLNAISQNAAGILVSSNFRDFYGYKIGDILSYSNHNGDSTRGVIYGFVDYWPSYSPVNRVKGSDGIYKEEDQFLIVAHLSQLQSAWGILPYEVWMKTDGSSRFIYDYAEESGTEYVVFRDAAAELVAMKNDPVFQGTNGILTVGFIVVLVLCATGFLIYWILSIQSRTLQFGIYRAMGMSGKEILSMLVTEQIFISGLAIVGGVLAGCLGSQLYVPLIQIAYSSADRVIPLEIIQLGSDFVRLGVVIGLMVVICMVILGMLISKIKITSALKLGED